MGSETLAVMLPRSLLARLLLSLLLLLRWPRQVITRTVIRTPRRTPGKNPARMASTGNLSQCAAAVPFCGDEESLGLAAIPVGVLDGFAVLVEAGLAITHWLFWHEKPFGQHPDPHLSSVPLRSVLWS